MTIKADSTTLLSRPDAVEAHRIQASESDVAHVEKPIL